MYSTYIYTYIYCINIISILTQPYYHGRFYPPSPLRWPLMVTKLYLSYHYIHIFIKQPWISWVPSFYIIISSYLYHEYVALWYHGFHGIWVPLLFGGRRCRDSTAADWTSPTARRVHSRPRRERAPSPSGRSSPAEVRMGNVGIHLC